MNPFAYTLLVSLPVPMAFPQLSIDAGQLLDLLGVDLATTAHDLEGALLEGRAMMAEKQARAAMLMQNAQFQKWLKSNQSSCLVVNGMDNHGDESVVSPMTYFSGIFSQTLAKHGYALPLSFFCGQHASRGDPMAGAQGMLRSLSAQLLAAYGDRIGLAFINDKSFLDVGRIERLCELFRGLLTGVGEGAIFCILDGVSWFESSTRIEELATAMVLLRTLTEEINESGASLVLKVLLLNPVSSSHAHKWFTQESIVSMKSETEGDSFDFGEMQMSEAME